MLRATGRFLSPLCLFFSGGMAAYAQDGQTFAIQNIASGKNLRPFEAGRQDSNQIVLYDHHSWKCLTWTFKQVGPDRYRLTNYYTGKTLDAASKPAASVSLVQHETVPNSLGWEFVAQPGDSYVSSPGRLYGRLLNNAGRSRYQFFRHSMGDTCFSARCGIC